MIRSGVALTFEETDPRLPFPACFAIFAALAAHGWCMADDEHPNHEDVLIGQRHIPDFAHADPRRLRRLITIRYVQALRFIEGDEFRVEEFAARCVTDPAFYRAVRAHRNFQKAFDKILEVLPRIPTHLSPDEHRDHGRLLIVPIGGDPVLIQRMDQLHQTTW